MNLGSIIERHAGRFAAKEAIVEVPSGRRVTYVELERRVEALAAGLIAHPELRPGDRLAIIAANTSEYIESILAAARAGMIAQGMNWRLSEAELVRVLHDSEPKVMVSSSRFAGLTRALQGSVDLPVWLEFGPDSDGSYDAFLSAGGAASIVPTHPGDPAFMMYTGGSTGIPKGVMHSHASCVSAMVNNTVAERITPADRYMLLGQMFHSAAVLVLNYLHNGATVVLVERYETDLALATIDSERVTAFLGFTTMMNYMLTELESGSSRRLASLRNLQYGGGPYAPVTIDRIIEAFPCGLIQNFGTTEHIGITFLDQEDHTAARAGRRRERLRSGGRPAFLTEIALFDAAGARVPADGRSEGEIYVRSPANMIGYWNRPEETARITRDGWLGTGDIGVIDDAGYLYVVGRAKDVIISGGENIYAAQVERAIASHPGVLESAVVGREDETWGECVVAYVVAKPGSVIERNEVRDVVGRELAPYQKPKYVHFIDELPRSPNGKVLKQEIVARDASVRPDELTEAATETARPGVTDADGRGRRQATSLDEGLSVSDS